ncbi:hypothetical protein SDC9_104765 [bioreactor metagenome]|uniref:Uncharacterized protein n=1 Tax=bioreactor metagenome TaxID=1076179 RepID=A0A645AYR7_9ZZZZ
MKTTGSRILLLILIVLAVCGFLYLMNYLFDHTEFVPEIFSGAAREQVLGQVDPGSPASLAAQDRAFARIAMFVFSSIIAAQAAAFVLAIAVVNSIRRSADSVKLRLKQLENADIFFDVPLYLGLFGTISGFLIMVFSTQSSLVIAYSSTLVGIILSLLLRLGVLYPLRRKLLSTGGDEK